MQENDWFFEMFDGRPDLTSDCGCERDAVSGEMLWCDECFNAAMEGAV